MQKSWGFSIGSSFCWWETSIKNTENWWCWGDYLVNECGANGTYHQTARARWSEIPEAMDVLVLRLESFTRVMSRHLSWRNFGVIWPKGSPEEFKVSSWTYSSTINHEFPPVSGSTMCSESKPLKIYPSKKPQSRPSGASTLHAAELTETI